MDRDDAALRAVQDVLGKTVGERGADPCLCANVVETVLPYFPRGLRRQCRLVALEAGAVVFDRHGGGEEIHRLLWGEVSIRVRAMGEAVTVQRAMAGDWLMEPVSEATEPGTFAVCESRSVLLSVPSAALRDQLGRSPDFTHAWLRELGVQMARIRRRIERLSLYQAPQRVIHYLMTESPGCRGEMVLPFRKSVWAAHLGMAPATLSRALTDLVNAGWLEMAGGNRLRLLRTA